MYSTRIKSVIGLLIQTSDFLSDHKAELENDISTNDDERCSKSIQNYILKRLETLSKDLRHDVNTLSAIVEEMESETVNNLYL